MSDNPRIPKLLHTRQVIKNEYFAVREDTIRLSNGKETTYIVAEPHDAVFIVALTHSRRYVLVKQYRHPIGRETWELPAGQLPRGVNPLEQAQVELLQEVGFRAKEVSIMAVWQANPGRQDQRHYAILATGLPEDGYDHGGQDADEAISAIGVYSREEVEAMIGDGTIDFEVNVLALFYSMMPRAVV